MSNFEERYGSGATGGSASPPAVTPNYGSSGPLPTSKENEPVQATRCATGIRFIRTINGILNFVVIVALVCVLISAGVSSGEDCRIVDEFPANSTAKVSAVHTRNAVLFFAAFGLFLILIDTILYVSSLINRIPATQQFEFIFIIVMLVLAFVYLILGCCAAAWEQKMKDSLGDEVKRKGAAAAAAFFIFVAMLAIIADFGLRLIRSKPRV